MAEQWPAEQTYLAPASGETPYIAQQPYVEEPLPEGWAAYQDAEGRTYYANAATSETSWTRPAPATGGAPPQQQEQAAPPNAEQTYGASYWSIEQTYTFGPEGCEYMFENKAMLLDRGQFASVATTVDILNSGAYNVEAGFCVIYSASRQTYYLLWREGKADDAFAVLGIDPNAEELFWDIEQCSELGPVGCEHIFDGKAMLLDKGQHFSVEATIDALNSGGIIAEAGFCILFSGSRQSYFLLWRNDKQSEAFVQLNLVPPAADSN